MTTKKRRVRPLLLVLLWVWAACVFVTLDLFLNVPEFDRLRPRARLYEAMRWSGHEITGEPYEVGLESGGGAGAAFTASREEDEETAIEPGTRRVEPVLCRHGDVSAAARDGGFTEWNDPGGTPGRGEYVDGRRHGMWAWNWPDGSKRETREYKNGVLHGKVASWYQGGQQQVAEEYADGKRHGEWRSWYPSGKPASEEHYDNGRIQGTLVQWHENGQKAGEAEFVAGSSVGPFVRWHANGAKAEEGFFLDGRKEGPWVAWDEGGNPTSHEVYVGGKVRAPGPAAPGPR